MAAARTLLLRAGAAGYGELPMPVSSALSEAIEKFAGAGDRFRTDDLVLGKHTLYQLSYTRSLLAQLAD